MEEDGAVLCKIPQQGTPIYHATAQMCEIAIMDSLLWRQLL